MPASTPLVDPPSCLQGSYVMRLFGSASVRAALARLARISWLVCVCAPIPFPATATPPSTLGVLLETPPKVSIHEAVPLGIRVTGASSADYVSIEVAGSGALQGDHASRHAADIVVRTTTTIRTEDEEDGRLSVAVTARTHAGHRIAYARTDLFAFRSAGQIFLSLSSLTDARMKAAAAGGSPTADLARLSRATAIETNHRLPPAPKRYAEAATDAAFGPPPSEPRPVIQALAGVTVAGRIEWTDSAGSPHPLPIAFVSVWEEDGLVDEFLGATTTDASGNYSIDVSHDDISGGPDIYITASTLSSIADVRPDVSGGVTYFVQSSTYDDQADGANLTINLTVANVSEADRAFGIHHALVMAGVYMNLLNGSAPDPVVTRFPTAGSKSRYASGGDIHIALLDEQDWDVIQHEYGHYVMWAYGFGDSPGGDHSLTQNLAAVRGDKSEGLRLAWGEGWATYFALAGQRHLWLASLGVPNVGDLGYQDTVNKDIDFNAEASTGFGEDNELSVLGTLWDLTDAADDGEDLLLPPIGLFQTLREHTPLTVGELWDVLIADVPNDIKARYGQLFARNAIAPLALKPEDGAVPIDSPGPFTWQPNGGGAAYPLDEIHVRLFDGTFAVETHDTPVGNATTHTFAPGELVAAANGTTLIRWVVTGTNSTPPQTQYWSNALSLGGAAVVFVVDTTGSMGQEIAGVRAGLNAFIDSFEGSNPAGLPTMHLVTFKDSVTHVATSADPAVMRAAIDGLQASGGGTCPESSAYALAAAAPLVADGGMVLLMTDASPHPGSNIGAAVQLLRERGVAVVTIVSGDCTSPAFTFGFEGTQPGSPGIHDSEPGLPSPADPGAVAVVDLVGDNAATAQEILVGEPVMGMIELPSDFDVFAIDLVAGTNYTIVSETVGGGALQLRDPSGDAVRLNALGGSILTLNTLDSRVAATTGVIPTTGRYFVSINSFSQSTYRILVNDDSDPFASLIGGVQLYSVVSAETGGIFADVRQVNSADSSEYVNTVFNALRSTLEGAVIRSSIRDVPRGARVTLALSGRGTNWTSETSVSLTKVDGTAAAGVAIASATVESPTSITMSLDVAADAELAELDVKATTSLGGAAERSAGVGVLRIVAPPTGPTLLGLHPARVLRGTTTRLTIQGINTSFTSATQVALGTGITVESVTPISATELAVDVVVSSAASLGYRSIRVTQGTVELAIDNELLVGSDNLVPKLKSLTPARILRGQTASLLATGAGTAFLAGVTTADFGPGVTVQSVTVTGATEAVVEVTAAADAAIGFRNVTLSTGTKAATLLDGFFVDAVAAGSAPPSAAIAPVATAAEGATVTLSGAQSADSDGTIEAYLWEQTAGPSVAIAAPSSSVTTFVAPEVAAATVLSFRLTVTDNHGLTGSATVDVSIADSTPPPAAPAPVASDDSSSGCFIATAAFGSHLHPHVETLRDFRDAHLLTNAAGRSFVAFYYRHSPPIAAAIEENPPLRALVRALLTPVVLAVARPREAALWATFVVFGALALRRLWRLNTLPPHGLVIVAAQSLGLLGRGDPHRRGRAGSSTERQ